MKILKVYDKINRNVFHYDKNTGNVFIREYINVDNHSILIVNTKIFKTQDEKRSYFSYVFFENGTATYTLELTKKYLLYQENNTDGKLIHSERLHLNDIKSFLNVDRIYDINNEFIELENYKGRKTVKFKIKEGVLNNLKINNHE